MVYPNPTQKIVYIQQEQNQQLTLSLFDMSGKLIAQQSLNQLNGQLDLSDQAAGIFLLEILDKTTGKRFMEKVVKGR